MNEQVPGSHRGFLKPLEKFCLSEVVHCRESTENRGFVSTVCLLAS